MHRAYEPLHPFSAWADIRPTVRTWQSFERFLTRTERATGEHSLRTLSIVAQATAIEITERLIVNDEAGSTQRDNIGASIVAGYATALSFAIEAESMTEQWIRRLHAVVCGSQTAQAIPLRGRPSIEQSPPTTRRVAFEAGRYKAALDAKSVVASGSGGAISRRRFRRLRRWSKHQSVFAPAHAVAGEMRRLLEELDSIEFSRAHPATQAAYAHYSLVAIHPFQDGNGRIARLMATVYALRGYSVAPLILAANSEAYMISLRRADRGDRVPLVDFLVRQSSTAVARWFASVLCVNRSDGA